MIELLDEDKSLTNSEMLERKLKMCILHVDELVSVSLVQLDDEFKTSSADSYTQDSHFWSYRQMVMMNGHRLVLRQIFPISRDPILNRAAGHHSIRLPQPISFPTYPCKRS
jgi:hypothetical protein